MGVNERRPNIQSLLREESPGGLEALWRTADSARKKHVGEEVYLRGLIEISNHCVRGCAYCGLRAGNVSIERYRMTDDEIMSCVGEAKKFELGTVVLQSGEDYGLSTSRMESLIRRIKAETGLAVTLSLGERPYEDLRAWRRAGADRYLLRFETSDPELYRKIHPSLPSRDSDRIADLRRLRELGYEAGGGVMVGIPGQSYQSLAGDILTFRRLDLDMIGIGPFIPHPGTPLGSGDWESGLDPAEQVPATETMAHKVLALARLVCPEANIPSTTALATINRERGFELGLMRGANVVMPNLTPSRYRLKYEIYPNKACFAETPSHVREIIRRIESIGRVVGRGPGGRAGPATESTGGRASSG